MAIRTWQAAFALVVLFAKGIRIKRGKTNEVHATAFGSHAVGDAIVDPTLSANPAASMPSPHHFDMDSGLNVYGNPNPFVAIDTSGLKSFSSLYGNLFDDDGQSGPVYRYTLDTHGDSEEAVQVKEVADAETQRVLDRFEDLAKIEQEGSPVVPQVPVEESAPGLAGHVADLATNKPAGSRTNRPASSGQSDYEFFETAASSAAPAAKAAPGKPSCSSCSKGGNKKQSHGLELQQIPFTPANANIPWRGNASTLRRGAGYVSFTMALNNIDFAAAWKNKGLLNNLAAALKNSIGQHGGGGLFPGEVELKQPADGGPLFMHAWIQLPSMKFAQSFRGKLASSKTFLKNTARTLENIPGAKACRQGEKPITVSDLRVSEAQESPGISEKQPQTDPGYVSFSVALHHLDMSHLLANRNMLGAVGNAIKFAVGQAGGAGTLPGEAQLKQPPGGPIWVHAWIKLPSMPRAVSFRSNLLASKTFSKDLAANIESIPGLKSVAAGSLFITDLTVSEAHPTPGKFNGDLWYERMLADARTKARESGGQGLGAAFILGAAGIAAQAMEHWHKHWSTTTREEEEPEDLANYHKIYQCPKEGTSWRKPCNSFKGIWDCTWERGCKALFDGCRPIMDSEFPSFRDSQFAGRTYNEPCATLPKIFGSGACESDCRCMICPTSGDCVRVADEMEADKDGRFWPKMENCTGIA